MKILFVDDEEIIRELTAEILRQMGHDVTVCATGKEVVEYYRKHWAHIDLVILDLLMPVMGGHEIFLSLKKINPRIRTLLATGSNVDGEAQAIIKDGVSGFLQKPFLVEELTEKIAQIFRVPVVSGPSSNSAS